MNVSITENDTIRRDNYSHSSTPLIVKEEKRKIKIVPGT